MEKRLIRAVNMKYNQTIFLVVLYCLGIATITGVVCFLLTLIPDSVGNAYPIIAGFQFPLIVITFLFMIMCGGAAIVSGVIAGYNILAYPGRLRKGAPAKQNRNLIATSKKLATTLKKARTKEDAENDAEIFLFAVIVYKALHGHIDAAESALNAALNGSMTATIDYSWYETNYHEEICIVLVISGNKNFRFVVPMT